MIRSQLRIGIVAAAAFGLGTGLTVFDRKPTVSADVPKGAGELNTLRAEVAALKDLLPDQSHAMSDVGYHFTNLWFAVQGQNWPLAEFYWSETKSHLHWAVRIKPIRKDNAKRDVNLPAILQALENGPLKQLGDAIAAKSPEKFVSAYRFTLENCYACHKASEKPYLRPQIPRFPQVSIINFDSKADWPR
jgi:hypothetical protein